MESHLLQMRGLKQPYVSGFLNAPESHLLQMRGLKLHALNNKIYTYVASFTDAWIETVLFAAVSRNLESHLLQMRGLKQNPCRPFP